MDPENRPLFFKPPFVDHHIQDKHICYHGLNFYVYPGAYVQGKLSMPVENAKVSILKKIKVGFYDTEPIILFTDENGEFKSEIVKDVEYVVSIEKEGYEFKQIPDSYDFEVIAQKVI